ncbi:MAG TPA: sigma 54-interacting transcriptional regulator, partial [Polyangiaceae bacterium]|nr:sigma 54-interacting transcriptional regulator [Polyangiaceae bacterium]
MNSSSDTATPKTRILVVDDEKNIRTTLLVCLEQLGHEATGAASGELARAALKNGPFDLAFVDIRIGKESGLDLIPDLLSVRPSLAIVMITAYATFDSAVEAVRRGAIGYLPKPFTPPQVRHVIDQALGQRSLLWRVAALEGELAEVAPQVDLSSASLPFRQLVEEIERAARSDATVLLRGESGTGKGVLARALHDQSDRRRGPFVIVNCPTLSEDLLASELFGHARGAFTGAVRDQ